MTRSTSTLKHAAVADDASKLARQVTATADPLTPGIVMPHQTLVTHIRAEFLEMPGLQLTLEQAQRFWGIDQPACRQVFDSLIEIGFLCVRLNGMYGRVTEGIDDLRPQTVKAIVKNDPERRAS